MQPVFQAGLRYSGLVHIIPRAIVHSPKQYVGLEFPQLYMEQLLAHLSMLLHYGPGLTDTTGILLRANAETFWLETSIQGKIFEIPVYFQDVVTDS